MAYDKTNSGGLFPNEKTKSSHPDFKGSINVDGVEYWLSAWCKTSGPGSRNPGTEFLSLSLQPKDERPASRNDDKPVNNDASSFLTRNSGKIDTHRPESRPIVPVPPSNYDAFDDDIPF